MTENFSEAGSGDFLDDETAESLESMEQEVSSGDFTENTQLTESFAEKTAAKPSAFLKRHKWKIIAIVVALMLLVLAMVYLGGSESKGSSDSDFGGEFSEF